MRCDQPAQQRLVRNHVDASRDAAARVAQLTGRIAELLPDRELAPGVEAVQTMGGVAVNVAVTALAG